MLDKLLRLLAPHPCSGCGNLGSLLCSQCKYDIISEPFERCIGCLHPTAQDNLCDPCRGKYELAGAWCVGARQGALKILLDRYKFNAAREATDICTELLLETLPIIPSDVVIVPVPTAPAHRRQRGFDHTARIARSIGRRRELAYDAVLTRHDNSTQHFKTRAERLRSAQHAITAARSSPSSVLLIDDIYTTGATLLASATALRRAGAERVYAAVLARQTLDDNE